MRGTTPWHTGPTWRLAVLAQEIAVVGAHLCAAWTLFQQRDLIDSRILPTDKIGRAYPEATAAGMSAALAGFAATFTLAAVLRRRCRRVGAAVERLWLAVPTLVFVAFALRVGDGWTIESGSPGPLVVGRHLVESRCARVGLADRPSHLDHDGSSGTRHDRVPGGRPRTQRHGGARRSA